jgi:hypothetical protein
MGPFETNVYNAFQICGSVGKNKTVFLPEIYIFVAQKIIKCPYFNTIINSKLF